METPNYSITQNMFSNKNLIAILTSLPSVAMATGPHKYKLIELIYFTH